MESYQDVKREGRISLSLSLDLINSCVDHAENIRRMFHRWLSAARSARHRRMILQQKEDEMKAACVAVAWDRWRERFVNEKLRPIVSLTTIIDFCTIFNTNYLTRNTMSYSKPKGTHFSLPLEYGKQRRK